jgi:hypothetical protein
MQYDVEAACIEGDISKANLENSHSAQNNSYGLADVLFPVTAPSAKGARLVLGHSGLRCSVTEQWHSERESVSVHTHSADLSATTAVATLSVNSESVPSHKLAFRSRRRADRAARNRSLLAAAGLDKSFESSPASAGL